MQGPQPLGPSQGAPRPSAPTQPTPQPANQGRPNIMDQAPGVPAGFIRTNAMELPSAMAPAPAPATSAPQEMRPAVEVQPAARSRSAQSIVMGALKTTAKGLKFLGKKFIEAIMAPGKTGGGMIGGGAGLFVLGAVGFAISGPVGIAAIVVLGATGWMLGGAIGNIIDGGQ